MQIKVAAAALVTAQLLAAERDGAICAAVQENGCGDWAADDFRAPDSGQMEGARNPFDEDVALLQIIKPKVPIGYLLNIQCDRLLLLVWKTFRK